MRRFGMFLTGGVFLLLTVSFAFSQTGEKKEGVKGGFGKGGTGGFGGMFGGAGNVDPLALLRNPDVKKELDISDEQMDKLPDAVQKAISGILSPEQDKRLRQIVLQQKGNNAFKDAVVQKDLKMTDDQAKSVETILADSTKELREMMKDIGGDFAGFREKMETQRKETKDKINGVLTADQRKAFRSMVGEEFTMSTPNFTRPGGIFGEKKGTKKKDAE